MARPRGKAKNTGTIKVGTSGATMKFFGVPEIRKLMGNYAKALGKDSNGYLRDEIKQVLMVPAMALRDEAQDMAPVVTGKLRDSIHVSTGKQDEPGVLVVVGKWYGRLVEMGTSKMSAQPFFRPAITATRGIVAAMISDGMGKLIEREAKKLAYYPPQK